MKKFYNLGNLNKPYKKKFLEQLNKIFNSGFYISGNFVSTFEVTPPGAAAINITPNANSTGVLKIIIKKYATIGSNTS